MVEDGGSAVSHEVLQLGEISLEQSPAEAELAVRNWGQIGIDSVAALALIGMCLAGIWAAWIIVAALI
jgi:hypothetical protein